MYMDATGTASKIFIMYHSLEADARRNLEHPTKTPCARLKNPTLPETNRERSENRWLEDYFSFGARPIFRGELLVSGSVKTKEQKQIQKRVVGSKGK